MTTCEQVRQRVALILDEVIGVTVLTGDETRLNSATLPAAEVRRGGDIRTYVGGSRRVQSIRLDLEIWVMVHEVPKPEKPGDERISLDLCDQWRDTIADTLARASRLETASLPGLVLEVGEFTLSRPGVAPYKDNQYGAFSISFSVRFNHEV